MHDIRILKETGVDGFVFGLDGIPDGSTENCKALLTLCNPLPVTFTGHSTVPPTHAEPGSNHRARLSRLLTSVGPIVPGRGDR